MPGGRYDSSKTRVAPVFDQLRLRTDDWVRGLLILAQHGSPETIDDNIDLGYVAGAWGTNEKGIPPPVALLSWLIRNLMPPLKPTEINDDRQRLLARDAEAIEQALQLLGSASASRRWHIFEGPTYPDALIETRGALIVVEGKRTEAGPTESTTWMAGRRQIWRHMDAAWERRGDRTVFGLFLVEGAPEQPFDVPPIWESASRDTLTAQALSSSFPHRGTVERDAIARGFLGAATWQRVCAHFGIDFGALPDTTADLGPA